MFERLKKRIKREKGFTLVELLAVIAILAIIVAIAVPTIGNVISKSETKANEASIELIENAARLADVSEDGTKTSYTITELKTAGYLEDVPKGFTGNETVTKENGVWTYGTATTSN
ncbi:prepilin-type N-terminal cleavage/methylation domain-containing protein [Virgibacillus flavescens]|uniref:prepilin-type N-terminal cleavage/methylation domain-containing protein n=1 Tax=Virgibacillus flavescens TaxID=1611422 RepID=UPI003D345BCB